MLTFVGGVWYHNRAAPSGAATIAERPAGRAQKRIQKNSKKCLTGETKYAIINKLSHGSEHSKTSKVLEYRTLKIKQYRKKLEGTLRAGRNLLVKIKNSFKVIHKRTQAIAC